MTDIFELQANFMTKGGQDIAGGNDSQSSLYATLVDEETAEFQEAWARYRESGSVEDRILAIKEICDLLVVASGWLVSEVGVDKAGRAYRTTHYSNLRKVDEKEQITRREDGKVVVTAEFKRAEKERLRESYLNLLGAEAADVV